MVTQDIPLCDAPHFTRLVNVLKLLTIDILVQEIHSVKSKHEFFQKFRVFRQDFG